MPNVARNTLRGSELPKQVAAQFKAQAHAFAYDHHQTFLNQALVQKRTQRLVVMTTDAFETKRDHRHGYKFVKINGKLVVVIEEASWSEGETAQLSIVSNVVRSFDSEFGLAADDLNALQTNEDIDQEIHDSMGK